MKKLIKWGVSLSFVTAIACQSSTTPTNIDKSDPVFDPIINPNDPDGLVAGLGSGSPQGSDFVINTLTTNIQDQPDVAVADNGTFIVVWRDANVSPAKIKARRLTFNNGSPSFVAGEELIQSDSVELLQPAVTAIS